MDSGFWHVAAHSYKETRREPRIKTRTGIDFGIGRGTGIGIGFAEDMNIYQFRHTFLNSRVNNWTELNWTELNWTELNWTELTVGFVKQ